MKKSQKTIHPLVSVVMPVYNAGGFLIPAIESILTQSYKNFELILVDDVSTDGSRDILQKYHKKFPGKIKLVLMKKNLNGGGDKCANEGVKKASGKYIARMDADDIAHKDRLTKQVAYLETHPDVVLLGSQAIVIDANGKQIGIKEEPLTHDAIKSAYMTFHPMIHPTCMVRRIIDNKPFMYKIKYSANNDYNTFFTLLCSGHKFANLKEKLLFYRIHDSNDTFKNIREKFFNTLKIRYEMYKKFGFKPSGRDIIVSIVQTAILSTLPEKVIKNLYLLSKGIKTPYELVAHNPHMRKVFAYLPQSRA